MNIKHPSYKRRQTLLDAAAAAGFISAAALPRKNQPYQGSLTSKKNRNYVEDDIRIVHGTYLLGISLNHGG